MGEVAELLQWLPAESARELIREEPLHIRVAEELAGVLVYLVVADQCGVDLKEAALGKIAASGEKYPVQSHRESAPTKTDRG